MQTGKTKKRVYTLRDAEARENFGKLGYELRNRGNFVNVGEGEGAVEVFEGFFVGFVAKRNKNESNRLKFLTLADKQPVQVFSCTVLDSSFLNEDATKPNPDVMGKQCAIVFQGINGKGKGAYKNYDVFIHPKKRLATSEVPKE